MGDKATLANARIELEDLYLGIPDESVDLTFRDLAQVQQQSLKSSSSPVKKNPTVLESIQEAKTPKQGSSPLNKLPSLDFNRGLQEISRNRHYHHHHDHHDEAVQASTISLENRAEFGQAVRSSMALDSVSVIRTASMYQEGKAQQRRRPGIPHSNICTICSTYSYIFRHRCLVFIQAAKIYF